jgi:cell wall-associated NlpC family hydrolase
VADKKYYVCQFGAGIQGRGTKRLRVAMYRLRRRCRNRATGPYHRQDHPKQVMPLPELADQVRKIMAEKKAPHKEVVRGSNYDEPAFSIISESVAPAKSPLVSALEPFVGRSSYSLGGSGPPGPSDCSGSTAYAAEKAYGVTLPHSALQQGNMPERFVYFTNPSEVRSGDFCWYTYTNRVGYGVNDYDHVDIYVRPGICIGSRPSTNGIGYYRWVNGPGAGTPDWAFRKFGRLRAA